jgi:hypothetical protein
MFGVPCKWWMMSPGLNRNSKAGWWCIFWIERLTHNALRISPGNFDYLIATPRFLLHIVLAGVSFSIPSPTESSLNDIESCQQRGTRSQSFSREMVLSRAGTKIASHL